MLLSTFMQVSASSFAQKVSISVRNAHLKDVFSLLRKQTGYDFLYNSADLNNSSKVSITASNEDLKDVLDKCLNDQSLTYTINKSTVLVKRKVLTTSALQLNSITGKVTDEKDEPLPGVSVRVKGVQSSTVTDANGNYKINVQKGLNVVLIFSYLGFATQEVDLGNKLTANIKLKSSNVNLDETVVVAYGTVNRSDLTGSVTAVNMEDISKAPVQNYTEALAGRIAGVQITSVEGQPGKEQSIVIRGPGTLTQDATPLYVIDGYPMENYDASAINTNDIESISVLKDASATALYGARAANGVIVIETKKGKAGKSEVTFSSTNGFNKIRKNIEVMNPYEFVKYQDEFNHAVAKVRYFNGKDLSSYESIAGVNWQDRLFVAAPLNIYNLSIRGGNLDTRYSISGAINQSEGIILNTGAKRYQGRVSIDHNLSKNIKVGVNSSYTNNNIYGVQASAAASNSATSYLFYSTWGYRPVSGRDDIDLNDMDLDDTPNENDQNTRRVNPYQTAINTYNNSVAKSLYTNAYISLSLTKELIFKSTGNISSIQRNVDNFYNSRTARGLPIPQNTMGVQASTLSLETNGWSNENTLSYSKRLNKFHRLNALIGFSSQSGNSQSRGVSIRNIPNEELGMSGYNEGTPYETISKSDGFKMASFFGRVNYNYDSKYLFTATFRADGSSKFPKHNMWGYFPSAAFAWNMSREDFLKYNSVISNSKIRLSYGETGNNRVTAQVFRPRLAFPANSSYSFNNQEPDKAAIQEGIGNQKLKWEVTRQFDIGYDLGLFKNRIELVVDLYRKTTSDLLLNAQLPLSTGYSTVYQNIGKVKNEGLEIAVNSVNYNKKLFKWSSSFNIAFNRNKILALVRDQNEMLKNNSFHFNYSSAFNISRVGESAGQFYGYEWIGNYQYEDFDEVSPGVYKLKAHISDNGDDRDKIQPGDIKYRDINEDGKITESDKVIIGRALPKHVGGIGNNISYKQFDLNVFFQWVYGNDIYNANRLVFEGNSLKLTDLNQYASYQNRWTPENQNNEYFRTGGSGPTGMHSSRVVEDGSFLRLKTLALGYTLAQNISKKIYLKNLRFNVSAQNLFTWTKYTGLDPEVSVRNSVLTPGLDYSAYPQTRTFVFGISATLNN
ncbi:TonB-dependent receptor [Pseudopedobacter beijingensis]|uniref:TonB-dependent receptor n=2 Tax=Pseudopedobacter beijingensis TaxID=1207056 RepID=A0ABW4I7Z2_9SPHI